MAAQTSQSPSNPQSSQPMPGISLAGAVDLEELKHKVQAEPGQEGGAPASGGYVVDTDEATFQSMVATSSTFPIMVLLWTPDDNRLFDMARRLGAAINKLGGKLQLSRIDVKANPTIARTLGVRAVPTLFALIAGQPIPLMQGLPTDEQMEQLTGPMLDQIVAAAAQQGVTGTAPMTGDMPADAADDPDAVPPAHAKANALAMQGEYALAAEEYAKLVKADPHDARAVREHAKALLLARSAKANVREVRAAAAAAPDDAAAQLAVADVDMIGGQIEDAFGRLLDFIAAHPAGRDDARVRLLEYFDIVPDDPRVKRARQRLFSLLY